MAKGLSFFDVFLKGSSKYYTKQTGCWKTWIFFFAGRKGE
jgi:hypothetical protein